MATSVVIARSYKKMTKKTQKETKKTSLEKIPQGNATHFSQFCKALSKHK